MSRLKAIIFDVDGTLADTERHGHRVAFNLAFEKFNLDWFWDEELYGRLLLTTGGKERIKTYIRQYRQEVEIDDDFINDLHKEKTDFYLRMVRTEGIPLRDGVRELITSARNAGITLAIATTTTYENISYLLQTELGKESVNWFTPLAAGDIVAHKKPAADIYDYVLAETGLSPQNCIALEDSRNGLRSSLGAGIRTVITTNGYTKDEDFTGASLVVDKIGYAGNPFKLISGNSFGESFVSLKLLEHIAA